MMENKIILNNKEYIYVINKKNIKNIYIRVKDDLKIHVSVNMFTSKKEVEKLLLKNINEIEKMYNKKNNNEIYYLGDILKFSISKEIYIDNNTIYAPSKKEAKDYIYTLAPEVFKERLDSIKPLFKDLPPFKLKIRHMSSKWGVCNTKSMSVTLNSELIKKDISLIDYVIIHELCHFKHMNHSKEFWSYVEEFYPYYKKARKELNY